MKKGPRCPVCGSVHTEKKINSSANTEGPKESTSTDASGQSNWKCFDCYRLFDKPDETE